MIKAILADKQLQKNLLWLNGALPFCFLVFDWNTQNLSANPPEAFIRSTGVISLLFLILSLIVTPASKFLGWKWSILHRRWLGLWSFYYGVAHLIAYSYFDKGLNLSLISEDIGKRPFILLGFTAFLLMLPLAVTSTNTMIKRMGGKKWKRLHRLTYLAALLGGVHFYLIVKSDIFYPLMLGVVIVVLLGLRLVKKGPHQTSS